MEYVIGNKTILINDEGNSEVKQDRDSHTETG